MKKTFRWTQGENVSLKKAADALGLSENDFLRLACAEKIDRTSQANALTDIQRQIDGLKAELDKQRSSLMSQIAGAHKQLSTQLNNGLAAELDMHLRTQIDVLERFGETARVIKPGKNPIRIDGMDLPPVIQKPTTK